MLFFNLFLFLSFSEITAQTVVTLKLDDPCLLVNVEEVIIKEASFKVEVYPNPASDRVTIKASAPDDIGEVKIRLVNLSGSIVSSRKVFSGSNSLVKSLDVSDLPRGTYIISVIRGHEQLSKKAIIH